MNHPRDPCIVVTQDDRRVAARTGARAGSSSSVTAQGHVELAEQECPNLRLEWLQARQSVVEADLRESESRFRHIAETIRDVFFLIDSHSHRLLYVSPAYEEIWGRTCASAYADMDSWTDAIHAEDRAETLLKYEAGLASGHFEFAYRIVRPDDGIRSIQVRAFPVRDETGELVRIAGVAEDVTERERTLRALRESDRRLRDVLANVQLVAMTLDVDACVTYCNDYLLQLTGWRREDVIGQDWIAMFTPDDAARLRTVFASLVAGLPDAWHHENEIVTRSGERRMIRWSNTLLRSPAGKPVGTASLGEDVTEQRRVEAKVRRMNRVYAVLSGINSLIIHAPRRDRLFAEACRIAVELGQFKGACIGIVDAAREQLQPVASAGVDTAFLAETRPRLSLRDDAPEGRGIIGDAIATQRPVVINHMRSDARILRKAECAEHGIEALVVLPLVVAGKPVGALALLATEPGSFDDEEMALLAQLTGDIAFAIDYLDKSERLDYLAYYDVLTGLANRGLFLERVAQFKRSAAPEGHKVAMVLFDLERFRNINDSFGQAAGDALLRQVADWLVAEWGDVNLLARVDADHFAAVIPMVVHERDVARQLEKTLDALARHSFRLGETELRVTAKAGVALFPDDGAKADKLFKHAEAALKKAKANGERYLFYAQKMTEAVAGKLQLENQLRQALDNEEFVLHYQPKVELVSGRLVGAEALIRWNDPRTGALVSPGKFIPILEETGLISEVGRWALRQALADYLRWRQAGLPAVRVAVNVSALQLRNHGFIAEVGQALAIHADAPQGLELEITESMIMDDVHQSIASLHAIRATGVSIAIDDFGTGFSSLGYLAKLPVDTVKIDRSFVVEMNLHPEGMALVSTIINLAHSLRLKVVAEGVETEEQSRMLHLLKCDQMQGFLLSRPVPAAEFEAKFLCARVP